MRTKIGTLGVIVVAALLLSGCLTAKTTSKSKIVPPEAGVTQFGWVMSMSSTRVVARGLRSGTPVVYVFDADGTGWKHSATLQGPPSSGNWGASLAVTGNTIAVGDPSRVTEAGRKGVVQIYDLQGSTWRHVQSLTSAVAEPFGTQLWATSTMLGVRYETLSATVPFQRGPSYVRLFMRRDGTYEQTNEVEVNGIASVGVEADRIAIGDPATPNDPYCPYGPSLPIQACPPVDDDNTLQVLTGQPGHPYHLLYESVASPLDSSGSPTLTDLYRKVDLAGNVLAYESGTGADRKLHIRRQNGTPVTTFPLTFESAGVVALTNVVLVANPISDAFQTYVLWDGVWQRANDIAAPDPTAGAFVLPSVAVGNKVAITGDAAIHVLTIEAAQS